MNENTKASMLKYRKANREQIQIDVAKGVKAKVKAYAASKGMSMSALIMQLLESEMSFDGFNKTWAAIEEQERAERDAAMKNRIEQIKAENVAAMLERMRKK